MSIEKLRQKYIADSDQMATKSRYGYFSILPSHTTAITDNTGPVPHRQSDGKVTTQPRNIFCGAMQSGTLKKSYFSYSSSTFHGSAYLDPGKYQRKLQIEQSKKWKGKQIFKPAKLNKTLATPPYPYMNETDPQKRKKNYRGLDGRVITENSNIFTSPQSKISFQRNKEFKYMESREKQVIEEQRQKIQEEPFKTGNPHKSLFSCNSQTFFDTDIKKKQSKKNLKIVRAHEDPFRPSCISTGKDFIPITYMQEGKGKSVSKGLKKQRKKQQQPFKLMKVEQNSKPCPSISLSKINLLRGYR